MELLAKLHDAYAGEPDAVAVEVLLCGVGEQEQLLRDGRVDVALLHRPFDSVAGLDVEELTTEGQIALLPAGHPHSGRRELSLADVADIEGLPAPPVGRGRMAATPTCVHRLRRQIEMGLLTSTELGCFQRRRPFALATFMPSRGCRPDQVGLGHHRQDVEGQLADRVGRVLD